MMMMPILNNDDDSNDSGLRFSSLADTTTVRFLALLWNVETKILFLLVVGKDVLISSLEPS